MKLIRLVLLFYFFVIRLQAQVHLEWVARYNGTANDWDAGGAITVDDSGYVYVTGAVVNIGTSGDFVTIKYAPSGNVTWIREFAGPGDNIEGGTDIILDKLQNVYVTGKFTIKYNIYGDAVWVRNWIDPYYAAVRIILKDNIFYLGGWTYGDFATVKYDTSGSLIWQTTYNGPGNDIGEQIKDMVLDSKDNVIVTGASQGIENYSDYATAKYSTDGDTLWVRRYSGISTLTDDYPFGITVDDSDNIYVTGWSDGLNDRPQCFTIKYSPDGDSLWSHRYPSVGTIGYTGYDIIYDRGYIYVVARAHDFNDTLLKYDLDGNLIWSSIFVTNNFATNDPRLVIDKIGNIYMTSAGGTGSGSDYIVVKYNTAGELLWEYRYRAISTSPSNVRAIYVDSSMNVYLTGDATGAGTNYDIVTLKLSQDSTTGVQDLNLFPSEFQLLPAYPNPFNSSTNIAFTLPNSADVDIKIYNLLGEEITTLISDHYTAGTHTVSWDAGDLPSGMYLCKLQAGNNRQIIKLLLMK